MTKLPPWSGDDDAMFFWLDAQLDDELEVRANRRRGLSADELFRAIDPVRWLRAQHPELAASIPDPKIGRGKWKRRNGGTPSSR